MEALAPIFHVPPGGKVLRAQGSNQRPLARASAPWRHCPARSQGCREWLGGQGDRAGFLGLFWSQVLTLIFVWLLFCFSPNLGFEVSWV